MSNKNFELIEKNPKKAIKELAIPNLKCHNNNV